MRFGFFFAVRQIARNRRKSVLLFLAMFVSLSLLIDMMGLYKSYKEMLLEDAKENYGAYHFYINDISENEYEILKNDPAVDSIGCENYMGTVSITEYNGQGFTSEQQTDLVCMDDTGFELNTIRLRFGRLPKNGNEIIISAGTELPGGYAFKVGQEGSMVDMLSEDGTVTSYTVVGVCDNFNAAQSDINYKAYTYGNTGKAWKNVYVTVTAGGNYHAGIKKLAERLGIESSLIKWDGNRIIQNETMLEDYRLICNGSLLYQIEEGSPDASQQAVVYIMEIMVAFILIVAAVIIWNIYSILVRERRNESGLLRVCGVSSYRLMLTGWIESGLLFIAALILSALLAGVGKVLTQQLVQLMRISALTGLKVTISYKLILLSALYVGAIVSVVVTLTTAAHIRGISPMQLLNGERESRIRRKKVTRSGEYVPTASFLIGKRNLLRNKGKTASIVLALAVVMLFFVTFSSFLEILRSNTVTDVTMITNSQYKVYKDGREALSQEFIDSIPNTASKYTASSTQAIFNIPPELKKEEYKELYNAYWHGYTADEVFNQTEWNLEVNGINRESYENDVEWMDGEEMTYDEWVESGKALIDDVIITTDEDGKRVRNSLLKIDARNCELTYNDYDIDMGDGNRQSYPKGKVELCGRVGYKMFCRENNLVHIMILLPEEVVRKRFDAQTQILYIIAERGKETEVGAWLKNNASHYDSMLDDVKKYAASHDSQLTTRIMLRLAFLLVVLISMMHIYNVVNSNLNSRKKEMAILMAMGMKRWQILKSVLWEHALYGIIGGAAGAAVSALLLERLLKLMSGASRINMVLPLDYMWIGLCCVVLESMAVSLFATRNIAKTSIAEEVGGND